MACASCAGALGMTSILIWQSPSVSVWKCLRSVQTANAQVFFPNGLTVGSSNDVFVPSLNVARSGSLDVACLW